MSGAALSLAVAVVLATVLLVRYRRSKVETAYYTLDTARKAVTGLILILIAWTLLRSGEPLLIVLALLAVAMATVYVLVERPHKTLV